VFGKNVAADIINQRDKVAEQIQVALAADLAPRGLIVEAVQIENIDFSDTYEDAVEAAAKAEADVKRARQELEQTKVNAQRQVAEAEAKAQATRTTADAEAYATRARGEAEAAAIAARGKALRDNPDLVALIAAEKWNGALPTTMVPGGSLPFVNVSPASPAAVR
jgi:regulator of protease activity HflC (stomatin/prohibitin superfamily)